MNFIFCKARGSIAIAQLVNLNVARDRAEELVEKVKNLDPNGNLLRAIRNTPLGSWQGRERIVHEGASRVGISPEVADAVIDVANGRNVAQHAESIAQGAPEEVQNAMRHVQQHAETAERIAQGAPREVQNAVRHVQQHAQEAPRQVHNAVQHVQRQTNCNQQ